MHEENSLGQGVNGKKKYPLIALPVKNAAL
jgi:hypothetical protein